ncbi:MAG TPA: hypothetical protein VEI97_12910 [bacterium]|nr:hypothetical protein [bacterium]
MMAFPSPFPTFALALALLVSSCQPDLSPAQPPASPPPARSANLFPLEEQVLARHDSLMLATGRLFELRQKLNRFRPALQADSARHPARAAALRRLRTATRATLAADDAMTDWMHAYRRPASSSPPDSARAYFLRQQRALDHVDSLTRAAHDSAFTLYLDLTTKAGAPRPAR